MDALVMCGGRGTRLDAAVEKPLVEVGGRPMVDRVIDALRASRIDAIFAVTSPHAPDTRAHLDCPTIATPGEGYVADLDAALDGVDPPVLSVAADLPLLRGDVVDRVIDAHGSGSLTVCVPAALKRLLGTSVDVTLERDGRELAPAGINVVADGEGEDTLVSYDARLAINVNRPGDAAIAEALA